MSDDEPTKWRKFLKGLAAAYPGTTYFNGHPDADGARHGGMFHSPTLRGERLAVLFHGEEPVLVPADVFTSEHGSAALIGNLGFVSVLDALAALREEDAAAADRLLAIVKRLGAKRSGDVTRYPYVEPKSPFEQVADMVRLAAAVIAEPGR